MMLDDVGFCWMMLTMMMMMMMMMMMAVFFPGNEVGSPPASTEVGE